MRVGIDGTALLAPQKTGIQGYATSLILALAEALPEIPDLELVLYFHTGNRYADASLLPTYIPQLGRAKIRAWRFARGYRLALPAMAFADRLTLLHLPEPTLVRFCACTLVVTVHDLCWIRLAPELVAGERMVNRPEAEQAIRMASAYIAVSQSTRNDLVAEYGVAPERVWVTYEGVDARYHPVPEVIETIRRKYGLGRYVLCVSTLQQRKNLVRLIEAYARLLTLGSLPHSLVLAGSKGWGYEQVYKAAERLGLRDRVLFLDYVPEDDLPGLYTGADLFIYPSLYEGFGLSVLEAMACGAPVAVSRTSSLPEVVGDAGLYFDPLSSEDIAKTMHQMLDNSTLVNGLRQKSLQRARQFTWPETARQTIAAYQRLIRKLDSFSTDSKGRS